MATATAPKQATAPKGRWRPRVRFGLGALLTLMTLCAVGLWYWFRVPVLEEQYGIHGTYFSSPQPNAKTNYLRERGYVLRKWGGGKVRHGIWTTYYEGGEKETEAEYREGLLHGVERRWTRQGKLTSEYSFRFGRRHGEFTVWDHFGSPATQGEYKGGLPTGKWQWRKLSSIQETAKGGKVDYNTIEGNWIDGLPHGNWRGTYSNGREYFSMTWDRGRLISTSSRFVDQRLAELIAARAFEDPHIVVGLMEPIEARFRKQPLMQVVDYAENATELEIRFSELGETAWPPTESYDRVQLTADSELVIPLTEHAEGYEIDWRLNTPATPQASVIKYYKIPIDYEASHVPLFFVLGDVLQPLGLGCDYRYGMIHVVHLHSIPWSDPTGVASLRPEPGTRIHQVWNDPANVDFIEMPLGQVIDYVTAEHRVPLDARRLPAKFRDLPVTLNLKDVAFKNALGMILDETQCQCRLERGELLIEPQAYQPETSRPLRSFAPLR